MAVTRFLVDKKMVKEDGVLMYKLYFYDSMDNVVIYIKAPVMSSHKLPEQEDVLPILVTPEMKTELEEINNEGLLIEEKIE
jgi:hypothetical protein